MIDFSDFSAEIFQILRAYGRDMVLYDENGNRVYEPTEARRMYVTGDNVLVSISEDGDHSALRLYLSPSMNLAQVKGFIETLRNMASKANLLFHVKKFDKEITPQEFASKASVNEQENMNMNLLEGMYGTSKSSYLKLENARMIVRHSERVKENMIGARGRSIAQIFVENAMGERFLFPVNMLSGARAMTQHVNQGGTFADDVGQQIIRMAQNFRDLARVAQHTNENRSALPETAIALRESVVQAMKGMKLQFNRVYETRSYVRECEKLVASGQLMEDGEQIAEKLEVLKGMLGEAFEESVLTTVARLVTLPEAQEPVIEEQEVADVVAEEEVTEVVSEEDVLDAAEDDLADDQAVEEAEVVVAEDDMLAPNNGIVKQFEAWMDEFDPEAALAESPVAEEEIEEATEEVAEEAEEQLDEYRVKKPDPEEMSVHDIKSAIMALKAERDTVNAFDPRNREIGSKIADLERELKKAMPYGKATTEGEEVPADEEQLDEYRVKKPEPEGMSMHDIKSAIQTFELKLRTMSPFDPEYIATRSKVEDLKRELAKAMPYGKATSESAEQSVEEGFDAEIERLAKLAGLKR